MYIKRLLASMSVALLPALSSYGTTVKVTVTNNSPDGGAGLAPVWVGFHDGSFDTYDRGSAAAPALETLAEVGNPGPLSDVFASNGTLVSTGATQVGSRVQGNTGVLAPGASETLMLDLHADGSNNYFSYASMVLPSNDYFIANGDPFAHDIHTLLADGSVWELNIGLSGSILDAGTELNDFAFSAGNPIAGLPPGAAPDGADEGGVITTVSGDPFAGFLSQPSGFSTANLDFNDSNLYPHGIATVRIEAVPEPGATLPLMSLGLVAFLWRRRRDA